MIQTKLLSLIVFGIFSFVVIAIVFFYGKNPQYESVDAQKGLSKEDIPPMPEVVKKTNEVPLPQEQDIIRSFFAIIDEGRPADAISLMTTELVGEDSSKQMWGVQFDAIESINVKSIEPSGKDGWTPDRHVYKVSLEVSMKPDSADSQIPYFGWNNGSDVRWIVIEKVSAYWRISDIATGP